MKFEVGILFALAILAGVCAMVRSMDDPPTFLTATCVTFLAAAIATALFDLGRPGGDRSCR